MKSIPRWAEALLIRALKEFVPASAVKEAFVQLKEGVLADLKELAASTDNKVDDALVEKVEQALSVCDPDSQFLCDLVATGKVALIAKLRELAAKSETKLDDAAVDILAEAMA
jgi:tRNA A37 threonylcarbamoyltransferase TsaD